MKQLKDHAGIEPTIVTFGSLMAACERVGNVEGMSLVLRAMKALFLPVQLLRLLLLLVVNLRMITRVSSSNQMILFMEQRLVVVVRLENENVPFYYYKR